MSGIWSGTNSRYLSSDRIICKTHGFVTQSSPVLLKLSLRSAVHRQTWEHGTGRDGHSQEIIFVQAVGVRLRDQPGGSAAGGQRVHLQHHHP